MFPVRRRFAAAVLLLAPLFARGQDQAFNLPEQPTSDRFQLTDRLWPTQHGQMHVCVWEDDKLAALSVSIDDNIVAEHDWWIALGERYGWRFTWFVIVWPYMYDYDMSPGTNQGAFGTAATFQRLFDLGHGVQGHGTLGINALPADQYEAELIFTQGVLQDLIPGNVVTTYAYPGGDYSNGKDVIAARHFISARGTNGSPNIANRTAYLHLNAGSLDMRSVDMLLDPTNMFWRGWLSPLKHLVGTGVTEIDRLAQHEAVEYVLDYVKSKQEDLWVALYRDLAMYGQERDTHTLTVNSVTDATIRLSLADRMMDSVFVYPLTVKVCLAGDWDAISATQGGNPIEASLILHQGCKYALVKAVPDRGEVVLERVTPVIVAAPIIEPDHDEYDYLFKGSFRDSVVVTLVCVTGGASIHYTLDGSTPDASSPVYVQPFVLTSSATVKARGFLAGAEPSSVSSAEFRVVADTVPPEIAAVGAVGDPTHVIVCFDEQVTETTASAIGNYEISPQVSVLSAALQKNGTTVILTTSALSADMTYSLLVRNVMDLSGNVIAAGAQPSFVFVPPVVQPGLMGSWDFDEDDGVGAAADASGNNNVGILLGAARDAGIRGNAVAFDGFDDRVDVGTSRFGMDVSNAMTLCFWLNLRGGSVGVPAQRGSPFVYPFRVELAPDRTINWGIRTSNTNYRRGSFYLENDVWYHVAMTYDGTQMRAYINGMFDTGIAATGALVFGASPLPTTLGEGFKGLIDELRIYNRPLTASQILDIYEGRHAAAAPTITPAGGTFISQVEVTLATTTTGAEIRYTTDGSAPSLSSPLYAAPFVLTASAMVSARTFAADLDPSDISSTSFTVLSGECDIAVDPGRLDFGDTYIGHSREQEITILNAGYSDLAILRVELAEGSAGNGFAISSGSAAFTLGSLASSTIGVTFSPGVEGPAEGTMVIESNDPDHPLVLIPLTGSGSLNVPPSAPVLAAPADGGVVTQLPVQLIVENSVDPNPGDLCTYDF
ncbi:MAG TPA: hypothetical protein DCM87_15825, partial [Planctomycetes bacterium]|nr:hypothetical protein [Planctomycetota bacterium]